MITCITGSWHGSVETNIKLIFKVVSATVILQNHPANAVVYYYPKILFQGPRLQQHSPYLTNTTPRIYLFPLHRSSGHWMFASMVSGQNENCNYHCQSSALVKPLHHACITVQGSHL